MKNKICIILLTALTVLLAGCGRSAMQEEKLPPDAEITSAPEESSAPTSSDAPTEAQELDESSVSETPVVPQEPAAQELPIDQDYPAVNNRVGADSSGIPEDCDHSFLDETVLVSCQQAGYIRHTCEKCGYTYDEPVELYAEHVYLDGVCIWCGTSAPDSYPGFSEIELERDDP